MKTRCKTGFTVTETVVAVVVITGVLIAAFPLLHTATRRLYQAQDHYKATTICLAQIERARDIPYDQLGAALGRDNQVRVNDMGANDPEGRFRRTSTIQLDHPQEGLVTLHIKTEIMDRRSHTFKGEHEELSYIFTAYLKPVSD